MRVSVAMATYNGEKYLCEQIDSILCQLNSEDEIVISDDGSTDCTINIIQEYEAKDTRVHFYHGPKEGVFKNFENAILHCKNDVVFLSDQDDIWEKDKVKNVIEIIEKNPDCVLILHNGKCFSEDTVFQKKLIHYKSGILKNIFMSSYWGCCMAFKKDFIKEFLPFKINGIAHDQLIGLLAERTKKVCFLDKDLIRHRIHASNVTGSKSLIKKIVFRFKISSDYFKVKKRKR